MEALRDQTDSLMMDTSTLFSMLVITVLLVQVFSLTIATNNAQTVSLLGRALKKRRSIPYFNQDLDPFGANNMDTYYDRSAFLSEQDFSAVIQDYFTKSPFKYGPELEDSAVDHSSPIVTYVRPPLPPHQRENGVSGYVWNFFSNAKRGISRRIGSIMTSDFLTKYEGLFLMIGLASTTLFVIETVVRIYRIYITSTGRRRRRRRKKRHEEDSRFEERIESFRKVHGWLWRFCAVLFLSPKRFISYLVDVVPLLLFLSTATALT